MRKQSEPYAFGTLSEFTSSVPSSPLHFIPFFLYLCFHLLSFAILLFSFLSRFRSSNVIYPVLWGQCVTQLKSAAWRMLCVRLVMFVIRVKGKVTKTQRCSRLSWFGCKKQNNHLVQSCCRFPHLAGHLNKECCSIRVFALALEYLSTE